MNRFFSRLSTQNWLLYVTVMSFVLGMILAACLNTQGSVRQQLGVPGGQRLPWLVQSLKEQQQNSQNLQSEIRALRQRAADYEENLATSSKKATAINEELQRLKFLVGITPAKGPGIILTLADNTKKVKAGDLDSELYIVHHYQLLDLINELSAAGAEAISINGHRIVSRTAIRCVGPSILINEEQAASPFVIRAIGSKDDLVGALEMPGGILEQFRQGLIVKLERSNNVEIPSYSGSTQVKHAKPVPLTEEKE